VQELLADWEIARQDGNSLSAEQLCHDCPELLAELKVGIEKLLHTSWLFESPGEVTSKSARLGSRSRGEFLEEVKKYGLVSDLEIGKVHADADAESIAAQFFDAGSLTQYQSDVLLGYKQGPIKLDRYVVLDEIGEGGMGKVYKALHTSMKRHVAIKMLSSPYISDERKSRFRREIQTVAALSHPNLVTAFDACEVEGEFFLAMELIYGENLAEIIREHGPMDFESASEVVRQIACAAEAAHQKGVIHRDIKPSNVVLTRDGPAKLVDLGIARIHADAKSESTASSTWANSTEITGDNVPIGTIAFMSPEQAMSAKKADERSDIYSLGCLFYYLLTGKTPFPGDNPVEVIVAHRELPIESVLQPLEIPDHGRDVLQRMLAKDPNDRFVSMKEVADSIERKNSISDAPKLRQSERGTRTAWIIGVALLLACFVGGLAWYSFQPQLVSPDSHLDLSSDTRQNDFARWVLNSSGMVVARTEFGEQVFDDIDAIPDSPIEITEMSLIETPSEFSVDWLTQLPELKTLTLDFCTLSGSDVRALKDLKALQSLSLTSCEVDKSFWGSVADMPMLDSLLLSSIVCSKDSLNSLNTLPQLKSLIINSMEFSDDDIQCIANLSNLEYLDLEATLVKSAPLAWAANHPRLTGLDLSATNLTDEDLKDQPICEQLNIISFESCDVGSLATEYISKLPNLDAVYLGETNVTDADLLSLASNSSITLLDVGMTKVTRKGLKVLARMGQLESLTLSGLEIGDEDLKLLLNLELSYIDLSNTRITDDALKLLSRKDLVELAVVGCDISDDAIEDFMQRNPSCDIIVEAEFVTD
jgi:serine/threonine protein kinase